MMLDLTSLEKAVAALQAAVDEARSDALRETTLTLVSALQGMDNSSICRRRTDHA